MTCCNISDHLGDEKGIEPGSTISAGPIDNFIFKGFQTADTGCPDNANSFFVDLFKVDTRILTAWSAAIIA